MICHWLTAWKCNNCMKKTTNDRHLMPPATLKCVYICNCCTIYLVWLWFVTKSPSSKKVISTLIVTLFLCKPEPLFRFVQNILLTQTQRKEKIKEKDPSCSVFIMKSKSFDITKNKSFFHYESMLNLYYKNNFFQFIFH